MIFTKAVATALISLNLSYPTDVPKKEFECLVEVIHYEARGEPTTGKMAVGSVVLNRVESDSFKSNTVCGVINQRAQFSYKQTEHYKRYTVNYANDIVRKSFNESVYIAYLMYEYGLGDPTHGATNFATVDIDNYWTRHFEETARIGNHVFYVMGE